MTRLRAALPRAKEAPLVPVNLFFSARRDTGAVLSAGEVTVTGGTEQAKNRPTTPEMVEKSLSKTGRHAVLCAEHAYRGRGWSGRPGVRHEWHAPRCARASARQALVAPSRDWMDGNVLPRDEEAASREGFAAIRRRPHRGAGESARGSRTGGRLCAARGRRAHRLPAVLPRVFPTASRDKSKCCSARR